MMTRRRFLTITATLGGVLALSACGRRNKPKPPEGSSFPRKYPDITFPDNSPGYPAEDQGKESKDDGSATESK